MGFYFSHFAVPLADTPRRVPSFFKWLPLRFRVPVDGGYTNLGTNFPVMRDLGQRLTHEIPNI